MAISKMDTQPILEPNGNSNHNPNCVINLRYEWTLPVSHYHDYSCDDGLQYFCIFQTGSLQTDSIGTKEEPP